MNDLTKNAILKTIWWKACFNIIFLNKEAVDTLLYYSTTKSAPTIKQPLARALLRMQMSYPVYVADFSRSFLERNNFSLNLQGLLALLTTRGRSSKNICVVHKLKDEARGVQKFLWFLYSCRGNLLLF